MTFWIVLGVCLLALAGLAGWEARQQWLLRRSLEREAAIRMKWAERGAEASAALIREQREWSDAKRLRLGMEPWSGEESMIEIIRAGTDTMTITAPEPRRGYTYEIRNPGPDPVEVRVYDGTTFMLQPGKSTTVTSPIPEAPALKGEPVDLGPWPKP